MSEESVSTTRSSFASEASPLVIGSSLAVVLLVVTLIHCVFIGRPSSLKRFHIVVGLIGSHRLLSGCYIGACIGSLVGAK